MEETIKKLSNWVFPIAGKPAGRMGVNNANLEIFNNICTSIIREPIQNSLDARVDKTKPVEVDYHLYKTETKSIPYIEGLMNYIKEAKNDWSKTGHEPTIKFFEEADDIINQPTIQILRISDKNTSGLTDSDKDDTGKWNGLISSIGVSDKPEGAGGSKGIGKHACLAASAIRTVIYSTTASDNLKATEGVNVMPSYKNKDGDMTTGKGFLVDNDYKPIRDCISFDPDYQRTDIGTDIYVLGFVETDDDIQSQMVAAVLEEFLIAIYKGDLRVTINKDVQIDKSTLPDIIERYKSYLTDSWYYYQVLIRSEHITKEFSVYDNPKAVLYLLMEENMNRKVMMCRNNGMKIMAMKNFPSYLRFSAICILDNKLNNFFREMENSAHNEWNEDNLQNKKNKVCAKKYKQELFKKIRDFIISKGTTYTKRSLGVSGLGEYFPAQDNNDTAAKANTDIVKNGDISSLIKPETPKVEKTTNRHYIPTLKHIEFELNDDGEEQSIKNRHRNPQTDPHKDPSDNSDIPEDNDQKDKDNDPKHRSRKRRTGDDTIVHADPKPRNIKVKNFSARIFISDKTKYEYKLIISTDTAISNGFLEFQLVGEDINSLVNIVEARNITNGEVLTTDKNKIFIGNFQAKNKYVISFTLDYKHECALGVSLYGKS